jgi:hypothetical protein
MPANIDASEENNESHGGIVEKWRRLRQLLIGGLTVPYFLWPKSFDVAADFRLGICGSWPAIEL